MADYGTPFFFVLILAAGTVIPAHCQDTIGIREAVNTGIKNNPELNYLIAELGMLEKQIKAGWTAFLPEVIIGFTGNTTAALNSPDQSGQELLLQLNMPLYDHGAAEDEASGLKTALLAARIQERQKREDYTFTVISAYLGTIKAAEINRIQRQAFLTLKRQTAVAENKKNLGFLTETAYRELILSFDMMRNEYFKTEAASKTAAEEFNILIGKSPGEFFPAGSLNSSFSGITGKTEELPDSLEHYLKSAEKNNPDLVKMNLEYNAALEAGKKRMLNFLPSVDLDCRLIFSGVNINENPPLSSLSLSFNFDKIMKNSELNVEFLNSSGAFRSAAGSMQTGLPRFESSIPGRLRTRLIAGTAGRLKDSLLVKMQGLLDRITYQKTLAALLREQIELNEIKHSIIEKRVELGELMLTDLAESQIELSRLKISLMDTASGILNSELELIRAAGIKAPVLLLETIVNEARE